MVKNTKGGKGAKSMARKSTGTGGTGATFPIPTSDMEHFAIVTKIFGPSCEVQFIDGTKLLCHIRNKFKGRNKSRNLILVGSIILIGYREWESHTARKNCDLLFVYDDLQTSSLADRFSLPSISSEYSLSSSHFAFDNSTHIDQHSNPELHTNLHNDISDTTLSNFDDL